MFHVLRDGDDVVAVLANVSSDQVQEAIGKVDLAFRRMVDKVPLVDLEMRICEDIGIAFSGDIRDYTNVISALLIDGGATLVDFEAHDCTPAGGLMTSGALHALSAGRTEEGA